MTTTRTRQQGLSLTQLLIGLLVVGFAALMLVRLGPVYLEAYSVGSILEGISEQTRYTGDNKDEIRETFARRLSINDIDTISARDLGFEDVTNGIEAYVEYEVRRPLIGNLDAVVQFRESAVVKN